MSVFCKKISISIHDPIVYSYSSRVPRAVAREEARRIARTGLRASLTGGDLNRRYGGPVARDDAGQSRQPPQTTVKRRGEAAIGRRSRRAGGETREGTGGTLRRYQQPRMYEEISIRSSRTRGTMWKTASVVL